MLRNSSNGQEKVDWIKQMQKSKKLYGNLQIAQHPKQTLQQLSVDCLPVSLPLDQMEKAANRSHLHDRVVDDVDTKQVQTHVPV